MPHRVFHIDSTDEQWQLSHEGLVLARHAIKSAIVETGVTIAGATRPSQLVVRREDGTMEATYDYGENPLPPADGRSRPGKGRS